MCDPLSIDRWEDLLSEVDRLRGIMDRLRGPDGCPWDREQTLETLSTYLLEETHEVLDAIASGSPAAICEELGDVLLQIVFQARVAQDLGQFDLDDVARGIAEKLVRRHPHVFGTDRMSNSEQVLKQWEQIKAQERAQKKSGTLLSGVPASLPALLKALRVSTKAARVGFDWPDRDGLLAKVDEELGELRSAIDLGDRAGVVEELGDLLFTLANVARYLDVDPESALQAANRKFEDRFGRVEKKLGAEGLTLSPRNRDRMEELWREVKREIRTASTARTGPSGGTSGSAPPPDPPGTGARSRRGARKAGRRGSPPASRGRSARRREARARSRR